MWMHKSILTLIQVVLRDGNADESEEVLERLNKSLARTERTNVYYSTSTFNHVSWEETRSWQMHFDLEERRETGCLSLFTTSQEQT